MTHTHLTRTLIAMVATLTLAPIAPAAGEPKNQAPFNAIRTQRATVAGELKNQMPFTRPLATYGATTGIGRRQHRQQAAACEAKNQPPFTRRKPTPRRSTKPLSDWFERYAAAHPNGRDPA